MDIQALKNKEEQVKELLKAQFETEIRSDIGVSSYIIFRDGTLVGAYKHRDMMNFLRDKGVLTNEDVERFDITVFTDAFGCVSCYGFTKEDSSIELPKEPLTSDQESTLADWIDADAEKSKQLTINFNKGSTTYNYDELFKAKEWPSDYIIQKIKDGYLQDKLMEDVNIQPYNREINKHLMSLGGPNTDIDCYLLSSDCAREIFSQLDNIKFANDWEKREVEAAPLEELPNYQWMYFGDRCTHPVYADTMKGTLNSPGIHFAVNDEVNKWIKDLIVNFPCEEMSVRRAEDEPEPETDRDARDREYDRAVREELRKDNLQELITHLQAKKVDIKSFWNICDASQHLEGLTDEELEDYNKAREELHNIQSKVSVTGFYKGEPDPGSYLVWDIPTEKAIELGLRLRQEDIIHTQISEKYNTILSIRYKNAQNHNFKKFDEDHETSSLVLVDKKPDNLFKDRGCTGWSNDGFFYSFNLYKEYSSAQDKEKFHKLELDEDITPTVISIPEINPKYAYGLDADDLKFIGEHFEEPYWAVCILQNRTREVVLEEQYVIENVDFNVAYGVFESDDFHNYYPGYNITVCLDFLPIDALRNQYGLMVRDINRETVHEDIQVSEPEDSGVVPDEAKDEVIKFISEFLSEDDVNDIRYIYKDDVWSFALDSEDDDVSYPYGLYAGDNCLCALTIDEVFKIKDIIAKYTHKTTNEDLNIDTVDVPFDEKYYCENSDYNLEEVIDLVNTHAEENVWTVRVYLVDNNNQIARTNLIAPLTTFKNAYESFCNYKLKDGEAAVSLDYNSMWWDTVLWKDIWNHPEPVTESSSKTEIETFDVVEDVNVSAVYIPKYDEKYTADISDRRIYLYNTNENDSDRTLVFGGDSSNEPRVNTIQYFFSEPVWFLCVLDRNEVIANGANQDGNFRDELPSEYDGARDFVSTYDLFEKYPLKPGESVAVCISEDFKNVTGGGWFILKRKYTETSVEEDIKPVTPDNSWTISTEQHNNCKDIHRFIVKYFGEHLANSYMDFSIPWTVIKNDKDDYTLYAGGLDEQTHSQNIGFSIAKVGSGDNEFIAEFKNALRNTIGDSFHEDVKVSTIDTYDKKYLVKSDFWDSAALIQNSLEKQVEDEEEGITRWGVGDDHTIWEYFIYFEPAYNYFLECDIHDFADSESLYLTVGDTPVLKRNNSMTEDVNILTPIEYLSKYTEPATVNDIEKAVSEHEPAAFIISPEGSLERIKDDYARKFVDIDGNYNQDASFDYANDDLRQNYITIINFVKGNIGARNIYLPDWGNNLTAAQYKTLKELSTISKASTIAIHSAGVTMSLPEYIKVKDDIDVNARPGRIIESREDYFKNSMVRNSDGTLKPVYHCSFNDFDTFIIGNEDGTLEFDDWKGESGFAWFSENEWYAQQYGDADFEYECYLNITNPLDLGDINQNIFDENGTEVKIKQRPKGRRYRFTDWWESSDSVKVSDAFINLCKLVDIAPEDMLVYAIKWGETEMIFDLTRRAFFKNLVVKKGYDGVIAIESGYRTWGCVRPNQIKLISNDNPTDNDSMKEDITPVTLDNVNILAKGNPEGDPSTKVTIDVSSDDMVKQYVIDSFQLRTTDDIVTKLRNIADDPEYIWEYHTIIAQINNNYGYITIRRGDNYILGRYNFGFNVYDKEIRDHIIRSVPELSHYLKEDVTVQSLRSTFEIPEEHKQFVKECISELPFIAMNIDDIMEKNINNKWEIIMCNNDVNGDPDSYPHRVVFGPGEYDCLDISEYELGKILHAAKNGNLNTFGEDIKPSAPASFVSKEDEDEDGIARYQATYVLSTDMLYVLRSLVDEVYEDNAFNKRIVSRNLDKAIKEFESGDDFHGPYSDGNFRLHIAVYPTDIEYRLWFAHCIEHLVSVTREELCSDTPAEDYEFAKAIEQVCNIEPSIIDKYKDSILNNTPFRMTEDIKVEPVDTLKYNKKWLFCEPNTLSGRLITDLIAKYEFDNVWRLSSMSGNGYTIIMDNVDLKTAYADFSTLPLGRVSDNEYIIAYRIECSPQNSGYRTTVFVRRERVNEDITIATTDFDYDPKYLNLEPGHDRREDSIQFINDHWNEKIWYLVGHYDKLSDRGMHSFSVEVRGNEQSPNNFINNKYNGYMTFPEVYNKFMTFDVAEEEPNYDVDSGWWITVCAKGFNHLNGDAGITGEPLDILFRDELDGDDLEEDIQPSKIQPAVYDKKYLMTVVKYYGQSASELIDKYQFEEWWYLDELNYDVESIHNGKYNEFTDDKFNGLMTFEDAYKAFLDYKFPTEQEDKNYRDYADIRLVLCDMTDENAIDDIDTLIKTRFQETREDLQLKPTDQRAFYDDKYLVTSGFTDKAAAAAFIEENCDEPHWTVRTISMTGDTIDYIDTDLTFEEAWKSFIETTPDMEYEEDKVVIGYDDYDWDAIVGGNAGDYTCVDVFEKGGENIAEDISYTPSYTAGNPSNTQFDKKYLEYDIPNFKLAAETIVQYFGGNPWFKVELSSHHFTRNGQTRWKTRKLADGATFSDAYSTFTGWEFRDCDESLTLSLDWSKISDNDRAELESIGEEIIPFNKREWWPIKGNIFKRINNPFSRVISRYQHVNEDLNVTMTKPAVNYNTEYIASKEKYGSGEYMDTAEEVVALIDEHYDEPVWNVFVWHYEPTDEKSVVLDSLWLGATFEDAYDTFKHSVKDIIDNYTWVNTDEIYLTLEYEDVDTEEEYVVLQRKVTDLCEDVQVKQVDIYGIIAPYFIEGPTWKDYTLHFYPREIDGKTYTNKELIDTFMGEPCWQIGTCNSTNLGTGGIPYSNLTFEEALEVFLDYRTNSDYTKYVCIDFSRDNLITPVCVRELKHDNPLAEDLQITKVEPKYHIEFKEDSEAFESSIKIVMDNPEASEIVKQTYIANRGIRRNDFAYDVTDISIEFEVMSEFTVNLQYNHGDDDNPDLVYLDHAAWGVNTPKKFQALDAALKALLTEEDYKKVTESNTFKWAYEDVFEGGNYLDITEDITPVAMDVSEFNIENVHSMGAWFVKLYVNAHTDEDVVQFIKEHADEPIWNLSRWTTDNLNYDGCICDGVPFQKAWDELVAQAQKQDQNDYFELRFKSSYDTLNAVIILNRTNRNISEDIQPVTLDTNPNEENKELMSKFLSEMCFAGNEDNLYEMDDYLFEEFQGDIECGWHFHDGLVDKVYIPWMGDAEYDDTMSDDMANAIYEGNAEFFRAHEEYIKPYGGNATNMEVEEAIAQEAELWGISQEDIDEFLHNNKN